MQDCKAAAFAILVATLWLAAGAGAEPLLPLPTTCDYATVADFVYVSEADALKAWTPSTTTQPVALAKAGPRQALRLPCDFTAGRTAPCEWSCPVKLDLRGHSGIQMRFYSPDLAPISVSGLFVYLESGDGAYRTQFWPKNKDGWETIDIEKLTSRPTGKPAGWGAIDRIRIVAERRAEGSTDMYIADVGYLGTGQAPVAILWNESAVLREADRPRGEPGDRSSRLSSLGRYSGYASNSVSEMLDDLGLPHAILSDRDLKADDLKGIELLVLPLCPEPTQEAAAAVAEYMKNGGKVVSFYSLSPAILEAAGLSAGETIQPEERGRFSILRPEGEGLAGLPAEAEVGAWSIVEAKPIEGRSRVAAKWYDSKGAATDQAAILVSENCVHQTATPPRSRDGAGYRVMLAMLGHFKPECWSLAARRSLEECGVFGPYENFAQADVAIRAEMGESAEAMAALDEARRLRHEATNLLRSEEYPRIMELAEQANDKILEAYCAAQPPKPGEVHAFWCHSAYGVSGMTWDEAIKNLADNGFNAIFPNMCWGGIAYYNSDVLPVSSSVAERGDQIAECLAACKKYGVECHVWKVNWNTGGRAPDSFVEMLKKEGRYQVFFDGTEKTDWLCPSHPANQKLEIDAMVEIAEKYDVDGVHFDYIRYPGEVGETCFCKGCRERFEKFIAGPAAPWPAVVHSDPKIKEQWLEFRRVQITTVVEAVAEKARKVKPGVKISGAVFRNWPEDRDTIGQDWKVWCDKGYFDFICPMDYTADNEVFEQMLTRQMPWVGKVPCVAGIGMSVWPDRTNIARLIDQIKITRRLGAAGFTIFQYDASAAREMAPLLSKGITRKE